MTSKALMVTITNVKGIARQIPRAAILPQIPTAGSWLDVEDCEARTKRIVTEHRSIASIGKINFPATALRPVAGHREPQRYRGRVRGRDAMK